MKYFENDKYGNDYIGSIKDAHPEDNPWRSYDYFIGVESVGIVHSLVEYGVFVKLPSGVHGLIKCDPNHFKVGSAIKVKIIESDVDRMRVLLEQVN